MYIYFFSFSSLTLLLFPSFPVFLFLLRLPSPHCHLVSPITTFAVSSFWLIPPPHYLLISVSAPTCSTTCLSLLLSSTFSLLLTTTVIITTTTKDTLNTKLPPLTLHQPNSTPLCPVTTTITPPYIPHIASSPLSPPTHYKSSRTSPFCHARCSSLPTTATTTHHHTITSPL